MGYIPNFVIWWFKGFPKYLGALSRRILIFVDNNVAFSVFFRNLFTPLFGDSSAIGRVIAFVYRLLRIISGVIIISIVSLSLVSLLLAWLILPFFLLFEFKLIGIVVIIAVFFVWVWKKKSKPKLRISDLKDGKGDIKDTLTKGSRNIISELGSDGFLDVLKEDKDILRLLKRAGLGDIDSFYSELDKVGLEAIKKDKLGRVAFETAKEIGAEYICPAHVFYALLTLIPKIERILYKFDLDLKSFKETVLWLEEIDKLREDRFIWSEDYDIQTIGGVNRDWTGRVTPTLNKYSYDLTEAASRGKLPKIIGKDKQVSQIIRILGRQDKRNVIIIGEPGSGKTTLVGGIANEIYKGTKHPSIKFRRLVSLDIGALTAGTNNFGELNERIKTIISEITGSGNIILFADEVHNLATALSDDPQSSTIFSVFEPHLDKADFQFIGATNVANYKRYIEPNGAFARLFEVVTLPEASKEETLKILKHVSFDYECKFDLVFTYLSLQKIIELSSKLVHDRVFPDKAVDILEESATLVLNEGRKVVSKEDIIKIISTKTSVPVTKIGEFESKVLLNMESEIHKRIIDQEEAVIAISKALRRARVGIREENRPMASFLFVGPTGVGKTETSKALAEIYFGGESSMVRIDMSEYQTKDSVWKMIGPPPGQPGAREGGQLTEKIKRNPFSLVLVDELEKAHSDILMLFLQVMDDGRLTDSIGKTISFTDTIVIATSNVGTKKIQEATKKGLTFKELKEISLSELRNRFPPEFLNRFSGIITFKPLSPEDVVAISKLMLKKLEKRLLDQGIQLEYPDRFVQELAAKGYSPEWGARPLRRLIEDKIEAPLAKEILQGKLEKGDVKKLELNYLED